ncbi:glucosidase, partial [Paraburkholderia sp. RL17-347-BIC-D]
EYAKADPDDILVRISVHNRGPEAARLRVLPTLWFRNTWSWGEDDRKPSLLDAGPGAIQATHPELGQYWLHCDGSPETLFTENESNAQRLWGQPNASPYVKDAFHAYVISGQGDAVNPARTGTKAAAHYICDVPGGGSTTIQLRLMATKLDNAFRDFENIFNSRIADADEFYERIAPASLTEDQRRVHRQALAGMLWSKQYYYFDLQLWLREHRSHPLLEAQRH